MDSRRTRADERAGAGLRGEAGRLRGWAARRGEDCYKQTGMLFTGEGAETIVGDEKLTPLITPYRQCSKLISHIQMSS